MNVAELKKLFAGTWRFSKWTFENFARIYFSLTSSLHDCFS